jgi:hypothetical protein
VGRQIFGPAPKVSARGAASAYRAEQKAKKNPPVHAGGPEGADLSPRPFVVTASAVLRARPAVAGSAFGGSGAAASLVVLSR